MDVLTVFSHRLRVRSQETALRGGGARERVKSQEMREVSLPQAAESLVSSAKAD